ncbi:hypothetical protein FPV67DRAFT_1025596 [Lyophyllum atratum]|nr:hypothetical protein FPV67DRAFT_1025596 [Lyophyllum atratum]
MSDYDDYFTDDIFLDDQTLAILDQEEQKYLTQAAPPPSKRQKTDDGWTTEISLSLGGSYGVLHDASRSSNTPAIAPKPRSANNGPSARTYPIQSPALVTNPSSIVVQRAPAAVTSRNTAASSFQHQSHSRPPSNSQSRPSAFQQRDSRGSSTFQPAPVPQVACNLPPQLPSPSGHVRGHASRLETQMQALQQKLEQVSEENKQIQAALKEAMGVRMAKEGEVTVLRHNAEKIAQEHAAQIAKLKSAREEAEAKQVRMQKEMREEVERMKTQFIFKQHEQESIRKPPSSTRPKKTSKEPPSTFLSTPSQLRWPIHQNAPSTSRGQVHETPTPRPSLGTPREVRKSPQAKRTSMLPGFQNTFNDTTPLRPTRKLLQKGNQDSIPVYEPPLQHHYPDVTSPIRQPRHPPSVDGDIRMDGPVEETFVEYAHASDADGDVDMQFGTAQDGSIAVEEDIDVDEAYPLEVPDWKVEVNSIRFIFRSLY